MRVCLPLSCCLRLQLLAACLLLACCLLAACCLLLAACCLLLAACCLLLALASVCLDVQPSGGGGIGGNVLLLPVMLLLLPLPLLCARLHERAPPPSHTCMRWNSSGDNPGCAFSPNENLPHFNPHRPHQAIAIPSPHATLIHHTQLYAP